MYTITNHIEPRIIEVKLDGLCSMEEFAQFCAELRVTITTFPSGPSDPATLYNFTDASIQTQEVVAAMKQLAENPAMVHRRVALYTEGALARRQAHRISENRPNMKVFPSRADALIWIASGADS